jgi:hypothetical protein
MHDHQMIAAYVAIWMSMFVAIPWPFVALPFAMRIDKKRGPRRGYRFPNGLPAKRKIQLLQRDAPAEHHHRYRRRTD